MNSTKSPRRKDEPINRKYDASKAPSRQQKSLTGIDFSAIERVELVLPHERHARICKHLRSDLSKEHFCNVLCGHAVFGTTLRLLAGPLVIPTPGDHLEQSLASVTMRPEFNHAVREECLLRGFSLVDFHSHPFSKSSVGFSGRDDADEFESCGYFQRNLPGLCLGSVILGQTSEVGRVFFPGAPNEKPRQLPLQIVRRDEMAAITPSEDQHQFDRQIRAFGREGQARLAQSKIGIVGLGGLGSILAIGLARLGVKHFVLIDHDTVEDTNLNRLAGSSLADARNHVRKSTLMRRRIRAIDPTANVKAIPLNLFKARAWKSLRDVDLLVIATDSQSSRMLANALSQQYLIPLISAGTIIQTDQGRFVDGCGEVFVSLPGTEGPCLLCSQVLDKAEAYYELSSPEQRERAARQGYIADFNQPDPAVSHLNGVVANLALTEIHNLLADFMQVHPHIYYSMADQRILLMEDTPESCAVCSPVGWNFAQGDALDPVRNLIPRELLASLEAD